MRLENLKKKKKRVRIDSSLPKSWRSYALAFNRTIYCEKNRSNENEENEVFIYDYEQRAW